jgi:DNA-binding XRE family transcriptional regulator
VAPGAADPQAATLASYVPLASFTEREAALMLPLLPSLIVEFGGPICFLIAGALFGLGREARPALAITPPPATRARMIEARSELYGFALAPLPSRKPRQAAKGGHEIAALRAALNENQEAFAVRLGVSVRTLRRWESGERAISRKAALQLRILANGLRRPALAVAA